MNTALNFFGFAIVIGVFIAFRQMLLNRRRRTMMRFHAQMAQGAGENLICPNCRNLVRPGAYCSCCGTALPLSLPMASSGTGRFLLYALMVVIGLIGLLAFFAVRAPSSRSHTVTPQFGVPPSQW